jgi:TRAP-type C4-dicarboxylate transport system substrate-binding protein
MRFMHRTLVPAVAALSLMAGAVQAEEIKVALNGVNDPAVNAEAAFVQAFGAALEGTDMTMSVFPSETLGKEKERFDQVSQGLIHVNLATTSTGYTLSPMLKGSALPFYFTDLAEFDKVMADPDLMAAINEPMVANGVRVVGFNMIGTDMGIHNSKHPVATMADMADLRFRALNAEQLAYQEALGSSATIVSWSEVANALQTGIADGYFNPPNSALRTGHTQYLKYFTPAHIAPSSRVVLISEDWYAGLSDSDKAGVDKAIAAGIAANRAWVTAWEAEVLAKQKEAGVTVTELAPGERDKMVAAVRASYANLASEETLAAYDAALAKVRQ